MRCRILVPTDFNPPSDAALSYARLLGNTFDASLHLLHVWEPVQPAAADLLMWRGEGVAALSDFARTRAGREMEQTLARLERRGIRARGRLETGDPRHCILLEDQ